MTSNDIRPPSQRRVRIDPQFLVHLVQKDDYPKMYHVSKNPLPDDAKVINITCEWIPHNAEHVTMMDLVIESETFTKDTPDPLPVPEITMLVTTVPVETYIGKEHPADVKDQSIQTDKG